MSIESISPTNTQHASQSQAEKLPLQRSDVSVRDDMAKTKDTFQKQAVESADESKARQEALAKAVSNLNQFFQAVHRELQFNVDDKTGRTIITVSDSDTNQVIRQIPGDEVLALARNIADRGEATLIQEEA